MACATDDDGQGDFFFNEEEVLAGAGGEQRAALLEQYDALLSMPRADELDEVGQRFYLET